MLLTSHSSNTSSFVWSVVPDLCAWGDQLDKFCLVIVLNVHALLTGKGVLSNTELSK